MRKHLTTLAIGALMLASPSFTPKAFANDSWYRDHQLHVDQFNEYHHPKRETEYPPAKCGWFCQAAILTFGTVIVAAAAAEYQKTEREKQLRASNRGVAPAR